MPRLAMLLLGAPLVTDSTGKIVEFKTAKNLALLAYLALESRRPHLCGPAQRSHRDL